MNMNKLNIEQVNDYENKSDYLMNKGKKKKEFMSGMYIFQNMSYWLVW